MNQIQTTPTRIKAPDVSTRAPNKRNSIVYAPGPTVICFHDKSVRDSGVPPRANRGDIEGAMNIVMRDLSHFKLDFSNSELLGKGTYGRVITAEVKEESHTFKVAVKAVNTNNLTNDEAEFLQREVEIWKEINYQYIVPLYASHVSFQGVYYIMEYGPKGDLCSYILQNNGMTETKAKGWFVQILNAINYLHSKKRAHMDIRAENVIIFSDEVVKVADLSFSTLYDAVEEKKFCGTHIYAAPEVTSMDPYFPDKADVWSLGILLFFMLTGQYPYLQSNNINQIRARQCLQTFITEIEDQYSVDCISVLTSFTEFLPNRRPDLPDVADMPWFEDYFNDEDDANDEDNK